MLLRLLLSTCRPSRWQLATTTGRKDLAADIDLPPPYLKNLVARKIFSNLTLHYQRSFINICYQNFMFLKYRKHLKSSLQVYLILLIRNAEWLFWLQESLFSPLIILNDIYLFFDYMIVHCTVDYLPKQFLPQNVWKEAKPAGKLGQERNGARMLEKFTAML